MTPLRPKTAPGDKPAAAGRRARLRVLFCFAWSFGSTLQAATYYVDFDGGDNSHDGQSQTTAWKQSPGDPNASGVPAGGGLLKAGDVVLFKGGVFYRGNIRINAGGAAGNPLIFKGDGWGTKKAIIEGADTFLQSSWTPCSSANECGDNPNFQNIYSADVPANFSDFRNGVYEDSGILRYAQGPVIPDSSPWDNVQNWYVIPMNSGTKSQTASTITDPSVLIQTDPQFWVGAYVSIWVNPNVTRMRKITSFDPTTHTISFDALTAPNLPYPHDKYDNYYTLLNHISLLDRAGRFTLDETQHKIYVWPNNSDNPREHIYSRRARTTGINNEGYYAWNTFSHLVIEGFQIQHFVMGIRSITAESTDVIIRNNDVTKLTSNDWYAIQVNHGEAIIEGNNVTDCERAVGILVGGPNNIVRKNFVSGTSRQGIWFMGATHSQIVHNTVSNINGQHANAISVYSNSSDILVAHNKIFNSAIPLTFERSNNLTLFNNLVDGGGTSAGIHDWGGMTGQVAIINNTFVRIGESDHGRAFSIRSPSEATYVSRNNIVDGGGLGSADYNIYNSLAWYQADRYGWALAAHELVQPDLNKLFVNPGAGDFHLLEISGATNTGIDSRSYLPLDKFPDYDFMVDLDGNSRYLGSNWDIGAYEYCEGNCVTNPGEKPGDGPPTLESASDPKFGKFKNLFNPTKEQLTITYTGAGDGITLVVYDRVGNEIKTLDRGIPTADGYQTTWDGRNNPGTIVASGMYMVVIKQGDKIQKKKVVVVK